ncbi:MAG: thioredoxin family protein [Bacteroidota bacterium]|nr:thioredoxin family protein [Candidatus Kapabacteria bacterium]MCS7301953.1 thioredoxin family protein [Candidatus Kapabacteria bacterium]MCX7936591.1 thioredoxin family protein [Chlorobiota bacterium]MDW8074784.1 thioredoxin family protein [Bacteroidota bacterium]MDW8271423.1 thioredoxin family protein [Bacteroidota bacterium]
MAAVESAMIPLGTVAPSFRLLEPRTNQWRTLDELASPKGTVIIFMCNHCPYVKHILPALLDVAREYIGRGIAFVGINPNDPVAYPEDSPEEMARLAEALNFPFPYLFDETQEVARSYNAMCTPDIFVFDGERRLVYRGQFDSSRPSNQIPPTGDDLRRALDALLNGTPVPPEQKPAIGCSIKWRK